MAKFTDFLKKALKTARTVTNPIGTVAGKVIPTVFNELKTNPDANLYGVMARGQVPVLNKLPVISSATRNVGSFLDNRMMQPAIRIPENISIARDRKQPLSTRALAGLSAVGGAVPMGPEDFAISGYDMIKAGLAGKNRLKGLTGEEFTPLGEAVSRGKQTPLSSTLNMAELPLLIAAGGLKGKKSVKGMLGKTDNVADIVGAEAKTVDDLPLFKSAEPVLSVPKSTKKGKQLGFVKTVKKSPGTSPKLVEAIEVAGDKLTYAPKSMKQSLKEATKIGKNLDYDSTLARLKTNADPPDVKTTLALKAMEKIQETSPEKASELLEEISRAGKTWGQGINMFKLWNQMTPAGVLKAAERAAKKVGGNITKETKQLIEAEHSKIAKMADGPAKDAATKNLLQQIANSLPLSIKEKFIAYAYQNMLSGTQTHSRNIHGNAFNTLLTRPMDLTMQAILEKVRPSGKDGVQAVNFGDVASYYKGMGGSVKQALKDAKSSFRQPLADDKYLEMAQLGDSAILALRQNNVPKALTVVTRIMRAQDIFFRSLIEAGETPRANRLGLAGEGVRNTAETYLYRNALGEKTEGLPYFSRILDDVGSWIRKGQQNKALGPLIRAFVPFVTTPFNVGKFMVEHSPAGFIGGKHSNEQLAKALGGTLITAIGTGMALDDRVVLSAPKDEKAASAFYASGRKPFSVRIGDNWIPVTYFGPLAFAFIVPAVVRDALGNNPESIKRGTDGDILTMFGNLAKFISSQTSMSSMTALYQVLNGEQGSYDQNKQAKMLGFMSTAAIPLAGLLRGITEIVDPRYLKASGFMDTIQRDMPFDIPGVGRDSLEEHTDPLGNPSMRLPINRAGILPYDIGVENPMFEGMYQGAMDSAMANSVKSALKKGIDTGGSWFDNMFGGKPEQVGASELAPTQPTGETSLDGRSIDDLIAADAQRDQKISDINEILYGKEFASISEDQKMTALANQGYTEQDIAEAKMAKFKRLSPEDKATAIMGMEGPDLAQLYKDEVLTTDVAKELQRRGYIQDASALMDKLKLTDPYYLQEAKNKALKDYQKDLIEIQGRTQKKLIDNQFDSMSKVFSAVSKSRRKRSMKQTLKVQKVKQPKISTPKATRSNPIIRNRLKDIRL